MAGYLKGSLPLSPGMSLYGLGGVAGVERLLMAGGFCGALLLGTPLPLLLCLCAAVLPGVELPSLSRASGRPHQATAVG